MTFRPVFAFTISHDFYEDGHSPDFLIIPDKATGTLLSNHRCRVRPLAHMIEVHIECGADGEALVPLDPSVTFTFHLQLQNAAFALFTDMSRMQNYQPWPAVYLHADQSMDFARKSQVYSETLRVTAPRVNDRFCLQGTPQANVDHTQFSLDQASGATILRYDPPTKTVYIDTSAVAAGTELQLSYDIFPKPPKDVLAAVCLSASDWAPVAQGADIRDFDLHFSARDTFWTYVLVSDTAEAGTRFEIVDHSAGGDVGFSPVQDDHLHPDNVPELLRQARQSNGHLTVSSVLFRSDQPIAAAQHPKNKIYLKKLDGGMPDRLLPFPNLRSLSRFQDARDKQTLVQVVKHLPKPLPKNEKR